MLKRVFGKRKKRTIDPDRRKEFLDLLAPALRLHGRTVLTTSEQIALMASAYTKLISMMAYNEITVADLVASSDMNDLGNMDGIAFIFISAQMALQDPDVYSRIFATAEHIQAAVEQADA